jgi:hypothetical protein
MEGRRSLSTPNADESVLGMKMVGGEKKGRRVLSVCWIKSCGKIGGCKGGSNSLKRHVDGLEMRKLKSDGEEDSEREF